MRCCSKECRRGPHALCQAGSLCSPGRSGATRAQCSVVKALCVPMLLSGAVLSNPSREAHAFRGPIPSHRAGPAPRRPRRRSARSSGPGPGYGRRPATCRSRSSPVAPSQGQRPGKAEGVGGAAAGAEGGEGLTAGAEGATVAGAVGVVGAVGEPPPRSASRRRPKASNISSSSPSTGSSARASAPRSSTSAWPSRRSARRTS